MSKSNLGNPIKEGCFLIGLALSRVTQAATLASWAAAKDRVDEATGFLQAASMDISQAKASDFITTSEAEEMRENIEQYEDAIRKGEADKAQDILAELTVKSLTAAFDKVVECECGKKEL